MTDRLPNNPQYRRLKASWRPFLGSCSYWLASDHLLVVEVIGTIERYRQIRLEDIQAVIVRPVRTRLIAGLVLGIPFTILLVLAAGSGIALSVAGSSDALLVGTVATASLASLLLPPLLFVVLGGTWCETRLLTGVQELRLAGLFRLPKARAFATEVGLAARSLPSAVEASDPTGSSSTPIAPAEAPPAP